MNNVFTKYGMLGAIHRTRHFEVDMVCGDEHKGLKIEIFE